MGGLSLKRYLKAVWPDLLSNLVDLGPISGQSRARDPCQRSRLEKCSINHRNLVRKKGSLDGFVWRCVFEVWPAPGAREGLQKCGGQSPPHLKRLSRAPGARMHPKKSGQSAFRYPGTGQVAPANLREDNMINPAPRFWLIFGHWSPRMAPGALGRAPARNLAQVAPKISPGDQF